MRLDYSPLHAGFAHKTTEPLWHSRATAMHCVTTMMTQFFLQLCAHFGSLFRQLREIVRELHKVLR
jgi:hypothetical protein